MKQQTKTYIGDSVYAEWNGEELILTTENGLPDDPSNHIVLGIDEIDALLVFINKVLDE